ncbi:MAG: SDR family oxidoreductase [Acidobacteria bacterium]|nr:SDR family oxidoreductase [Acidobacteriota bacterium]
MQTIFITGSSTGLGRATAILFATHGWNVIATMRRPDQESELARTPGITLLPLDVTDRAHIAAAARRAIELGGVDVLFNNAGYGLAGPLEGTSDEQLTQEVDTNLLGVIRTTQAFLPHFREKRAGLIITTTSIGGLVTFPFNSVYHATKWALEGWSESMAFELEPFNIQIKTVSPGFITTDFATRSLVLTSHPAYVTQVQKVMAAFSDPERAAQHSSAEQIAEVVHEAATDGKDKLRYLAGSDAKAAYAQRLAVGAEAFRKGIRARFLG